jgi:probable rRNA maturation factor
VEIVWDNRSGNTLPNDWQAQLTEVVRIGIEYTGVSPAVELSISFVTPDEIRRLNCDYRQIDSETDVLSFPAENGPLEDIFLGDIFVCVIIAKYQAELYHHSFWRELAFLTVHGLLHLLGYTHENERDEACMRRAQADILQKAGIHR